MIDAQGKYVPFDQISAAHVEGNLQSVPLPPAGWVGLAMLVGMGGMTMWKRRASAAN
jgi:hypothetical protein